MQDHGSHNVPLAGNELVFLKFTEKKTAVLYHVCSRPALFICGEQCPRLCHRPPPPFLKRDLRREGEGFSTLASRSRNYAESHFRINLFSLLKFFLFSGHEPRNNFLKPHSFDAIDAYRHISISRCRRAIVNTHK